MASVNAKATPSHQKPLSSNTVDSEVELSLETVNSSEEVAKLISNHVELSGSLLPRSFALKSVANNKYMRCESGGDVGGLVFSLEGILWEPRARYEVELTNTEGVVHIRSTFNNKYLRKESESSQWIKALATEKSGDTSQMDCTMFKVLPATQSGGQIRLQHVNLGHYLSMVSEGLAATAASPSDGSDHFTFFNCSTLVILPRYVAFKGHNNGKYLACASFGGLLFSSSDKGEEGVTMEVVPASDGNFYIKADLSKMLRTWTLGFIFNIISTTRVNKGNEGVNSLFQVAKDEDDLISLKHVATNKFCRTMNAFFPYSTTNDMLVAEAESRTQDTKMVMEEALIKRTLDIEWCLEDARVYDVVPDELKSSMHDNNSSSTVTKEVTLAYQTAVTSSFESSNTWSVGLSVSIKTPSIPFIGGVDIKMSGEYGGTYTWGKSKTTTSIFSETDTYTIPPRTRLVVKKLSTKGFCDVPYKYVQTDYLFNGDIIITNKEDGVYKGVNYFNIYTTNNSEPIRESLWVD